MHCPNKVNCESQFFQGEHLPFSDLRKKIRNRYLDNYKFLPKFPQPVEFHLSNLQHDTNLSSFQGILNDGGFKSRKGLVWWSLSVSKNEIKDAEERLLYQYRMNLDDCKPFLHKFTSSPAFSKSSRLGNFRFTFSMNELLFRYAEQFCMGKPPQMRVYGTTVYKQEVMYGIVVHGPDGQSEFKEYPVFPNSSEEVCTFQDKKILWHPQGMSNVHAFRLSSYEPMFRVYRVLTRKRKYHMWDHVSMIFHVPNDKIFKVDKQMLLNHLSLCQGAQPKLSNENFIKCEFEASSLVHQD